MTAEIHARTLLVLLAETSPELFALDLAAACSLPRANLMRDDRPSSRAPLRSALYAE